MQLKQPQEAKGSKLEQNWSLIEDFEEKAETRQASQQVARRPRAKTENSGRFWIKSTFLKDSLSNTNFPFINP